MLLLAVVIVACSPHTEKAIDREALLQRNNPVVTCFDTLASLSVGNGNFAMTVDATGLQTFPEYYAKGVCLGTQSSWGWHSFPNPEQYKSEEALREYDFGHGQTELYSVQYKTPERNKNASDWLRVNPHRLHLGSVGFELPDEVTVNDFSAIQQKLNLQKGIIESHFELQGNSVNVQTVCHPEEDRISAHISATSPLPLRIKLPYPTGKHTDDGCDWEANDKHTTDVVFVDGNQALLKHHLDETDYYVLVQWEGDAELVCKSKNYYVLTPDSSDFAFSCTFLEKNEMKPKIPFDKVCEATQLYWTAFWNKGGMVDFSDCTDARAAELERRVVLSQYLLAIQCAGNTPPQETGLTFNSWFGKFHLEMIWWHQAQFALWGHPELLERTLSWYKNAEPVAREIAQRQGFDGVRWMKMTDPSGMEAPSSVGSFLIWQQPHLIHLAELDYRSNPSKELLESYYPLIEETANFMVSFATYDEANDRYLLKGVIAAQETLKASETFNPPLELSAWHYGLSVAQQWRERLGMERCSEWDEVLTKLSPLASDADGVYLAAESATDSYSNERYMNDHPAVLGALGMYPASSLVDETKMSKTLHQIWGCWHWDTTWGWDYPMFAMCATRLGEPQMAVDALLKDTQKNTYLPNGHNYQDGRLRIYLPGNGGLLATVALMCAGWDGCKEETPGFPKDGKWNVRWEGLLPMP